MGGEVVEVFYGEGERGLVGFLGEGVVVERGEGSGLGVGWRGVTRRV